MNGSEVEVPTQAPVVLRLPARSDAEALYEAVKESVAEVQQWMDWATEGYEVADALSWIEKQHSARADGSAFGFLIVDPEELSWEPAGSTASTPSCALQTLDTGSDVPQPGEGLQSQPFKTL